MPLLVFAGSGFFGAPVLDSVDAAREHVRGGSPLTPAGRKKGDGAIHSFVMSDDGRALTPVAVAEQGGTFPMFLATDASRRFLYAAETPAGDDAAPGFVNAYAVAAGGRLTPLNRVGSGGAVPCHLAAVGRTLLVANFVGGNVAALPIRPDGSLGAAVSVHDHGAGAGGHPSGRMDKAHPHMVQPDPAGTRVFVCDLGRNSVIGYRLDADKSVLTRESEVVLHPGAGPRHLAFSAAAPFAYTVNEMDNTITPLRYDPATGALRVLDGMSVSALPDGTEHRAGGGGAEIVVSGDGRFAYASVRMTGKFNASPGAVFNTIAVLALDRETGAATRVANVGSGGNMPWCHTFCDGDDGLLVVQNQHTAHTGLPEPEGGSNEGYNGVGPGRVVVFARDREGGGLAELAAAEVPHAMSVLVVRRAATAGL